MKKTLEIVGGGYKHYEVIDFLKGFSILSIVIYHLIDFISLTPAIVKKGALLGGSGIHIFIFCSGFGLYLSYLNNPKSYFEFIKTRFKKIYIPYILIILIAFFIPFTYEGSDRFIALLSHILLFKMFVPGYEESFVGPTWFVSTIIQFYFIFVPLCYVKRKMDGRRFTVFGLCISICWWIIVFLLGKYDVSMWRTWNCCFLQFLWEFVLGMSIAEIMYNKKTIVLDIKLVVIMAFLGLSVEALCGLYGHGLQLFNDIPALIGFGSVGLVLYKIDILEKPIKKISTFSYEWFLIHMLVFQIIFQLKPNTLFYQLILAGSALLISMLIAYAYSKITNQLLRHLTVVKA